MLKLRLQLLCSLCLSFVPGFLLAQSQQDALARINPFRIQSLNNEADTSSTIGTTQDTMTDILPDRRVTFRLQAPKANSASVILTNNTLEGAAKTPMKKDAQGLWSVTLGPLESRVWEYQFLIDGATVHDPGNGIPKPQREGNVSTFQIPGSIEDVQNVPHGRVIQETYFSYALGINRTMLVYTPPSYEETGGHPYPVLFLYNGWGDTPTTNVSDAKVNVMLDNLIAQKKVLPMVVVLPDAHALPSENVPIAYQDIVSYLKINQAAGAQELYQDILPFVNKHYHVRKDAPSRAITGLSIGGIQALETGITHLGDFDWIGAFSPEFFPGVASDQFQTALTQANAINSNIRYLYLGIGNNDVEAAIPVLLLQLQFLASGIHDSLVITTPGNHNTDTCRREFYNFLLNVFKDSR